MSILDFPYKIQKRKEEKDEIIQRINPLYLDEYTKVKYYEYYRIIL